MVVVAMIIPALKGSQSVLEKRSQEIEEEIEIQKVSFFLSSNHFKPFTQNLLIRKELKS